MAEKIAKSRKEVELLDPKFHIVLAQVNEATRKRVRAILNDGMGERKVRWKENIEGNVASWREKLFPPKEEAASNPKTVEDGKLIIYEQENVDETGQLIASAMMNSRTRQI